MIFTLTPLEPRSGDTKKPGRKSDSSTQGKLLPLVGRARIKLAWQEGYEAFSVSRSNSEAVKRYIDHQEEHHAGRLYETEFIVLLDKSGLQYERDEVFG